MERLKIDEWKCSEDNCMKALERCCIKALKSYLHGNARKMAAWERSGWPHMDARFTNVQISVFYTNDSRQISPICHRFVCSLTD